MVAWVHEHRAPSAANPTKSLSTTSALCSDPGTPLPKSAAHNLSPEKLLAPPGGSAETFGFRTSRHKADSATSTQGAGRPIPTWFERQTLLTSERNWYLRREVAIQPLRRPRLGRGSRAIW
jgi:hypothetical protein